MKVQTCSSTQQQPDVVDKQDVVATFLTCLPDNYPPYEEFVAKFGTAKASTEAPNPITMWLSQVMQQSTIDGLQLLHQVDEVVVDGLNDFIPQITAHSAILAEKLQAGGRIVLVGAGSSGRMCKDLAAKCKKAFPSMQGQIVGFIAGGDSAMVRAKEGSEDSDAEGEALAASLDLGRNDTVILVSSSGSSSFNVGFGHAAANADASVLYFYNSEKVPERTQKLFDRINNPVSPLVVDIGGQAIAGSTRLQGATIAQACLGPLLAASIYRAMGIEMGLSYAARVAANMTIINQTIEDSLPAIAKVVAAEEEVFSHADANFDKPKDTAQRGYVTLVSGRDSILEVLADVTEMPPTYSTNGMRAEGQAGKRPDYDAKLIGVDDNAEAWATSLGHPIEDAQRQEVAKFLLAMGAAGENSYANRSKGEGNLIIGVEKVGRDGCISDRLRDVLRHASTAGAKTAALLICSGVLAEEDHKFLEQIGCLPVVLEDVPDDQLGVSKTIALKQTLNLLSNGTMVRMKKVHGNLMIDVKPANLKLVNRCMGLVKTLLPETIEDKQLYHYVCHIAALTKDQQARYNIQLPSAVKLAAVMLHQKLPPSAEGFQAAVNLLRELDLNEILSAPIAA